MESIGLVLGFGGLILLLLEFSRWVRRVYSLRQQRKRDKVVLQRFRKSAEINRMTRPDLTRFGVKDFWRQADEQAHVTAVVSGKGGVGKSSIALALMEYYSKDHRVLLVDFDLHNRGLTSLFSGVWEQNPTTVLGEMERFRKNICPKLWKSKGGGSSGYSITDINQEEFVEYREAFCYREIKTKELRPLRLAKLPSGRNPLWSGVRPSGCAFLPGRGFDQSFLGSDVFNLNIPDIAIFIKYLASWASRASGDSTSFTRIILDCHGAQDLFTVGATVAADHLVLVTKPDPGAFEGTLELITFSKTLADTQRFVPRSEVLLVNEFRSQDREAVSVLLEKAGRSYDDTPTIEASESIREMFRSYTNPSAFNHSRLWEQMPLIAEPYGDGSGENRGEKGVTERPEPSSLKAESDQVQPAEG